MNALISKMKIEQDRNWVSCQDFQQFNNYYQMFPMFEWNAFRISNFCNMLAHLVASEQGTSPYHWTREALNFCGRAELDLGVAATLEEMEKASLV